MLSPSVAQVNVVLMLHAEAPLSVAQIARAAGLKYTPAASAIATLEKRGLVRRVGRLDQDLFEPNRDDPHYPMAYGTALVDLPIRDAIRGQRVYAAYAYGSLSRPGGGTRNSDLDVLIVGDVKDRENLVYRLSEVGSRLSRRIDPLVLDPEQLEQAKRKHDQHVEAALAGVRILGSV